jgi:hypothetical protein
MLRVAASSAGLRFRRHDVSTKSFGSALAKIQLKSANFTLVRHISSLNGIRTVDLIFLVSATLKNLESCASSVYWTKPRQRNYSTRRGHSHSAGDDSAIHFKFPVTPTPESIHGMIEHFKKHHVLDIESAMETLTKAHGIFQPQPTLMEFETSKETPLTVIGDVHGQFYDVLHIFELNGLPSPTNRYLFNGDIVDRGHWGSEILFTLIAFKMLYPDSVHINAGNHEDRDLTTRYGFRQEILEKYNENVYKMFLELFKELPLASVINSSTFVVHGGLPGPGVTLHDVKQLPKRSHKYTVTNSGPSARDNRIYKVTTALLWSDPYDDGAQCLLLTSPFTSTSN